MLKVNFRWPWTFTKLHTINETIARAERRLKSLSTPLEHQNRMEKQWHDAHFPGEAFVPLTQGKVDAWRNEHEAFLKIAKRYNQL